MLLRSVLTHLPRAGINPQWALLYWPQTTRQYVSAYVALAGDFHGTAESLLLCGAPQLSPCAASVYQQVRVSINLPTRSDPIQTIGSKYLAAQNKRGNTDLLNGRTVRVCDSKRD